MQFKHPHSRGGQADTWCTLGCSFPLRGSRKKGILTMQMCLTAVEEQGRFCSQRAAIPAQVTPAAARPGQFLSPEQSRDLCAAAASPKGDTAPSKPHRAWSKYNNSEPLWPTCGSPHPSLGTHFIFLLSCFNPGCWGIVELLHLSTLNKKQ